MSVAPKAPLLSERACGSKESARLKQCPSPRCEIAGDQERESRPYTRGID